MAKQDSYSLTRVEDLFADHDDWSVSSTCTSSTTGALNVSPQELAQPSVRQSTQIHNPVDCYTPASTLKGGSLHW